MIDAQNHRLPPAAAGASRSEVDLGLRSFLLAVLGKTALGLSLAAGVASAVSEIPALRDQLFRVQANGDHTGLAFTGFGMAVAFSPILLLLLFGFGRQTRVRSALLYWSVAASIGAAAGAILLIYTGASVATTFAAAAAGFGALSLFGYTTARDLSAKSAFLTTGLIGLVAAMALNLLLGSAALAFAINTIGVLVFAGLIAYDMQRLKLIYHHARENGVALEIATNMGALCLFLDFVNLYQFLLLAISGQRR